MNSDQRSRGYYDAFSDHYEVGRDRGYHFWLDERSADIVLRHGRDREVLEVGCGTGLILQRVAPHARRAVGLDLSPGMLSVAKSRGLDVIEGTVTSLPFPDASFDTIYSFKVLAHVPDLSTALSEMARVVRPGGKLILEFYNRQSLRWLVRQLRPAGRIGTERTEDDVFTRFHSLRELRRMLPPQLHLTSVEGMRIATLVPQLFEVPHVGSHWATLENTLSDSPLRYLAGFLVLVLERR